ncbi:hypothetical protein QUF76_12630 [Desulfobacterales bacterium HSG16]|nr:hypothetical protein [Desulfobacterales bacterium HSG16]
MQTFFVEISKQGSKYKVIIHKGNPKNPIAVREADIGPKVRISIKGKKYFIKDLIKALIGYNKKDLALVYDERGQFEIGKYLFDQVFAGQDKDLVFPAPDSGEIIDVRIISQNEYILSLPWVLLADSGVFLTAFRWAVSLSIKVYDELTDWELPPSPKMLIVAPQPAGAEKTHAESHIAEIEDLLSSHDLRFTSGKNILFVHTWEEFTAAVKEFCPQIVYYYGHGEGNFQKANLVFATGRNNQRIDKPVADFAHCLRNMEHRPYLIYVNCCQGDTAGFLGVGVQLGQIAPAVITNRTIAKINAAQAQAKALWKYVLLKGVEPHKAMSLISRDMTDMELSLADVRWMTPVMHCGYKSWKSNPPEQLDRTYHDPHWHLKIDRVTQYHTTAGMTRQMLREQKPKSLSFVWYGQEGQGIDIFHERLDVELRNEVSNTHLYPVKPAWPYEFVNPARSFTDMLNEAFEVGSLEDIPARIREKSQGAFGRQTLVYVRHSPVTSPQIFNPRRLKLYLEWWDSKFVPLLENQHFALLGISFIVKNPPKFKDIILKKERVEDLYFDKTVFKLLDEMEKLAKRDLLDFLQTHKMKFQTKRRDKLLDRILKKTGGHYEKTVEELKNLVQLAFDELGEDEGHDYEKSEDDNDY